MPLLELTAYSTLALELLDIASPTGYTIPQTGLIPTGSTIIIPPIPTITQPVTVNIIQVARKYVQVFTNITGSYTILGTVHGLGSSALVAVVYDNAIPANDIIVPYTVDPVSFDVVFNFLGVQSGTIVLM